MTPMAEVAEEDRLRLGWYSLLARLLSGAPDREFLVSLAALEGDETELGEAVQTLAQVARRSEPKEIEQEHFTLFIGVGQGDLRELIRLVTRFTDRDVFVAGHSLGASAVYHALDRPLRLDELPLAPCRGCQDRG